MGLEDLRGFQKFDLLFLKILIEIRGLLKMEIFFQKMRLCVGQFFFEHSKIVRADWTKIFVPMKVNTNNHSFESSSFAHFDQFWISKLTFFLWKRFWRRFSPRMKIYFKITFFTCIALEWAFLEFLTQKIIVLSQAFLLILIDFGFQNWRFSVKLVKTGLKMF